MHKGARTRSLAQVAQRRKKRIAAGRATEEDKQFIEVGLLRCSRPACRTHTLHKEGNPASYVVSAARGSQPLKRAQAVKAGMSTSVVCVSTCRRSRRG